MKTVFLFLILSTCIQAQLQPDGATASFRGSLPPKPTGELSEEQVEQLKTRLAKLTAGFESVSKHTLAADVEIFLKAVRYALQNFHSQVESSFRISSSERLMFRQLTDWTRLL
ncbi:MAG: hypothetical protein NTY15_01365 [Planctomycetota bacterium]|nr:hypothetical protein [Planctomycetota bacterium]